jgi:outer membrane protein assembly factor BamB
MISRIQPSAQREYRLRSLVTGVLVVGLAGALLSASTSAAQPARARHQAAPLAEASLTDWPSFHGGSSANGLSPDTTISDTNASQLGVRWMTPTMAPVLSSPVTAYDSTLKETLAYVGNNDGYLEAINVATGSLVWSDNLQWGIYSTPAVYGGSVWVGTAVRGYVYKLNATTGAVQCSITIPGGGIILGSPTIATPPGGQPTVYYGVQDNGITSQGIHALDEATCASDWSVIPWSQESGSWDSDSYAVDAKGTPLVFAGAGALPLNVVALNAKTGKTVWAVHARELAGTAVEDDIGAALTVSPPGNNGFADGMVYLPSRGGYLQAIDLTTGQEIWTYHYIDSKVATGGRSTAALAGSDLVFGYAGGVQAVNAVTGKPIWNSATTVGTDPEVLSDPLVTGPAGHQVVVYGDLEGRLLVLSLATGKELYSFQTHGYITAGPADSDGNILITSSDGFAYDVALGGTNSSAYPSTSISSPADGSAIPATATVTANGTATSANCNGVLVAVQQNGLEGSFWNAAAKTWQAGPAWNQATLGSAGCASGWSLSAPVGNAGAVLEFFARATDADGEVDPTGATSTVDVKPAAKGAHLALRARMVAPGLSTSVSGDGFTAGEKVQIALPGVAVLATATATSSGSISKVKVQVPRAYPVGPSGITATGETSGRAATAELDVAMSWPELSDNPDRTSDQTNDAFLGIEFDPDKALRLVPATVYETGAPVNSSPAVNNLVAYVGNNAGDVDAVSTTTGTLVWQAKTGGAVDSSPAVDPEAGLVVVGSGDGNVYAFKVKTGATAWKTSTGQAVNSSPTIVNGVVYVGSNDGKLYALSEATGAQRWSSAVAGEVTTAPAVDAAKGEAVVGDSGGDVTAFATGGTKPGTVLWTFKAGGAAGTPLISGGTVYVGSADGHEYAVNESTGAKEWSTALGGTPSPAALDSKSDLAVGTSAGGLFVLKLSTGKVIWKRTAPGAVTGVAATSGMVFLECANGVVAGYRPSGAGAWLASTGAGLSGTPAVVDNAVIVGAGDTGLYVYTPNGLPMV